MIKTYRLVHVEHAVTCDQCGEEMTYCWVQYTRSHAGEHIHRCKNGHEWASDKGYPFREWVRERTRHEFTGTEGSIRLDTL